MPRRSELGRVAIIGAGPAGLGAAFRLKELGHEDFVIYESSAFVGGLAASAVDDKGFTWDIGGHVQFSHYAYFDRVMDSVLAADEWLHHQRESWVWIRGRFVPYPFQYNIRRLPQEELDRCLRGLEELHRHPFQGTPAHFGEWVLATFGAGMADLFMTPYNLKVWAYPLAELSYGWVGERVAVTDLGRVRENIRIGKDDTGWGPNNTFRFPRRGGTGAIWTRVADRIGADRIRLQTPVSAVRAARKELVLGSGARESFDAILNTSPLDRFAPMVEDLSPEVREAASGLRHSGAHIVGVGLRGKPRAELAPKCWMYFPEDDCPFYRVTVFSNYSPENVPDIGKYWSLMAETSESPRKPVRPDSVVEETVRGLLATGLIESRGQIESLWTRHAPYGYPTPSLGRDAILDRVHPALEALGISSRGRFGAWKYEASNQDHSFMQGVEWVDRLSSGAPELTFPHPAKANAGVGR
ncbi:MAG: FAD-dependent oxidoreductase [Elusimicrobia bacterium]|nr:FAD-dependent oxidoreductase [Elusimicrobiota bacterium]